MWRRDGLGMTLAVIGEVYGYQVCAHNGCDGVFRRHSYKVKGRQQTHIRWLQHRFTGPLRVAQRGLVHGRECKLNDGRRSGGVATALID